MTFFPDCFSPLGMESHKIPYRAITASSERNFWHRASKARLSSRPFYKPTWMCPGWSPSAYDVKPWLQIYLGYPNVITRVATQGGRARRAWNWVTGYKISYSMDGKTWRFYKTPTGATKVGFHFRALYISSQNITLYFLVKNLSTLGFLGVIFGLPIICYN